MPAKDVIQYDYKIFELNGRKCGVGTLETTSPDYVIGRKQELLKGMSELKSEQNLNFIMLCVVDILEEKNTTIVLDEDSQVLDTIFGSSTQENLADL
jgi:manganese-dependent inorganic pyrophosphatase